MLYFPLFKGYLPDWLPIWGGDYFIFFRPVFNLADFAISCGVGLLIIYQKSIFKD
jgi:signal peptidase II